MKHNALVEQQHGTSSAHPERVDILPISARDPGEAFLRREIEANRRSERILVLRGVIALLLVGILVAVRQVFFV
jgi:hypothetical protein